MMEYPTWFEVALNELDYDMKNGLITEEAYERALDELYDELEEYENG